LFKFEKSFALIANSPLSAALIIGVVLILLLFMRIRRVKLNARIIAQIGMALAMALLLKAFRLYHLPQGGSITLGSMVPILILSVAHGPWIGVLTGFLYGILSFMMSPYVLHPVQVLFDYPLPYIALGLAGLFRDRAILGGAVAIFGRFLCHFISSVASFASYAPIDMSPVAYSLMVNGIFLCIEGGICLAIINQLPLVHFKQALIGRRSN
jgi:thiamine transporter